MFHTKTSQKFLESLKLIYKYGYRFSEISYFLLGEPLTILQPSVSLIVPQGNTKIVTVYGQCTQYTQFFLLPKYNVQIRYFCPSLHAHSLLLFYTCQTFTFSTDMYFILHKFLLFYNPQSHINCKPINSRHSTLLFCHSRTTY